MNCSLGGPRDVGAVVAGASAISDKRLGLELHHFTSAPSSTLNKQQANRSFFINTTNMDITTVTHSLISPIKLPSSSYTLFSSSCLRQTSVFNTNHHYYTNTGIVIIVSLVVD